MASLKIDPIAPGQAVLHKVQTTDDFLTNNSFMYQVLPNGQGTSYSYSGNSRIQFDLTSNSDMVDFSETHLMFNYTTTLTEGNAARQVGMRDQARWLEGGAVNVIRNIQIQSLAGGTLIENIQGYNKLQHIISCVTEEPNFIDRVKCKRHDSMNEVYDVGFNGSELRPVWSNSTSFGGARPTDGDFGVTPEAWGVVLQPSNDDYKVVNTNADGADLAAMIALLNARTKKSVRAESFQQARTASQRCTLKLNTGLFKNKEWFPLLLTKGISIIIELEAPEFVCQTGVNPQADNGMSVDYSISTPKLYCRLVTPSQSLVEQYVKAMNNDNLNYQFGTYDRVLTQIPAGSAGNISFQLPVSRRSISHTISVIQNPRKNALNRTTSASLNSYNYPHRYINGNMTSVQWQCGSQLYPISGVVEIDRYNARPMELLLTTFGLNGEQAAMRMKPYEFQCRNTDSGNADNAHKLILAYRFSKDYSPFTGLDTSNGNYIQMNLTSSGAYQIAAANQPLYVYSYVGYDSVLSITKNGLIVRR